MMCASERKSLGSIVPKIHQLKHLPSYIEAWFVKPSLFVTDICRRCHDGEPRQHLPHQHHLTTAFPNPPCLGCTLMIMVPKLRYDLVSPTCLQGLNCNWGGVVPKALPHLSELAMAKFPHELEAGPLDLPLVPRVVGQVGRNGLLQVDARLAEVHAQPVRVP